MALITSVSLNFQINNVVFYGLAHVSQMNYFIINDINFENMGINSLFISEYSYFIIRNANFVTSFLNSTSQNEDLLQILSSKLLMIQTNLSRIIIFIIAS